MPNSNPALQINFRLLHTDTVGLVKPHHDIHTLGIATVAELLKECGIRSNIADGIVERSLVNPQIYSNFGHIHRWLIEADITVLGISFRLDPDDAVMMMRKLLYQLDFWRLSVQTGGRIRKVLFAGLPPAVDRLRELYPDLGVFYGDESPAETVARFGIDPASGPQDIFVSHPYDDYLKNFGRNIINAETYRIVHAVDRTATPNYGTSKERLVDRIAHAREQNLPPLMRAHIGPYHPDRYTALTTFGSWLRSLAVSGLLDIVSIGTSQLSQERFGENWEDAPNGGGIPVNSAEEYRDIYEAARPMLVRTYAGTYRMAELARIHEESINIAWHALSLWWFSEIDGRGPYPLLENLREQFRAIRYIANTGKPLEPNIPHHFGFRGADDITYVVSAILAARSFKRFGIRNFVLQLMLNVPKHTLGINDLAKARAILTLLRPLQDREFNIYVQPRAGLDFLSHKPEVAKAQLAHATAMMDDIVPFNTCSPDIIHVVSYSEGYALASPLVVDESIQITRYALDIYRQEKRAGHTPDTVHDDRLQHRLAQLLDGAQKVLAAIEDLVPDPYTPEGLYQIFVMGFLPVPHLLYCRDKYLHAMHWRTKIRNGGVDIYDERRPVPVEERLRYIREVVVPTFEKQR